MTPHEVTPSLPAPPSELEAPSRNLSEAALTFLDRKLGDEARTVEINCGVSTLLFAAKACHHTCFSDDDLALDRLREYCKARQISTERIYFRSGDPNRFLPYLSGDPLDLVLLDGSRPFPLPILDWHYLSRRLRVDGLLLVSGTLYRPGQVLKEHLVSAPQWEFVESYETGQAPWSAAFRKVSEPPFESAAEPPAAEMLGFSDNGTPEKVQDLRVRYDELWACYEQLKGCLQELQERWDDLVPRYEDLPRYDHLQLHHHELQIRYSELECRYDELFNEYTRLNYFSALIRQVPKVAWKAIKRRLRFKS